MSSVTTASGLFSGIPTQDIIDAIVQQYSRPRQLAEARLVELQVRQAALLDVNSRTQSLRTAAGSFRSDRVFDMRRTSSSDETKVTATASTNAQRGSYKLLVDRLVSTQQRISRGFADTDRTGAGATGFSFEPEAARLDRDTSLSELNGGAGVERGVIKIEVYDFQSTTATVDLSRASTLGEAVGLINDQLEAENIQLRAEVSGGGISLVKNGSVGYSALSITNTDGRSTAADLGISTQGLSADGYVTPDVAYSVFRGSSVFSLSRSTSLSVLNDGNGIDIISNGPKAGDNSANPTFSISAGGATVNVQLGARLNWLDDPDNPKPEDAVTTLGGVIDRINEALQSKDETSSISAQLSADGLSIELANSDLSETIAIDGAGEPPTFAARDLGLVGGSFDASTGVFSGTRLTGGPNQVLLSNLNGGDGLNDRELNISTDSDTYDIDLDDIYADGSNVRAETVQDLLVAINTVAEANAPMPGQPEFRAELDDNGTGFRIVNLTGSGVFEMGGDAASELGLDNGEEDGAISTGNLQRRYVAEGTLLSSLNGGEGVGQGTIAITDSFGTRREVRIDEDIQTVGQLLRAIEKVEGLEIEASINANGDGILLREAEGLSPTGGEKIRVEDVSGQVAIGLGLRTTASGLGGENYIDASFERTVEFDPEDTLDDIVDKINAADAGVTASIISDGSSGNPYRLSLTSLNGGVAGRKIIETGDLDMGFRVLDRGENARVFYGGDSAADGLLLESVSNELSGIARGVTFQLSSVTEEAVQITVSDDVGAMEEAVGTFVTSFNDLIANIDLHTRYYPGSDERGALLGDGTINSMRASLLSAMTSDIHDFSQELDNLADVGITLGAEGQLEFDSNKFRTAYEDDPDGVRELFTRRDIVRTPGEVEDLGNGVTVSADPNAPTRYGALGPIPFLENVAATYVTSLNGVLTLKAATIDDQIASQEERIASLQSLLDSKRSILERQFLAMESAIAELQAQQSSLSQVSSIG